LIEILRPYFRRDVYNEMKMYYAQTNETAFLDLASHESSRNLGFHGKCAIHPAQIAIINKALTPTEEEVAKACQVLVVNRQGVGSVDGKMVDEAIARKARLILERAPGSALRIRFLRRVQTRKTIIKRRPHG
jgi:citrate lyase beta subunit